MGAIQASLFKFGTFMCRAGTTTSLQNQWEWLMRWWIKSESFASVDSYRTSPLKRRGFQGYDLAAPLITIFCVHHLSVGDDHQFSTLTRLWELTTQKQSRTDTLQSTNEFIIVFHFISAKMFSGLLSLYTPPPPLACAIEWKWKTMK